MRSYWRTAALRVRFVRIGIQRVRRSHRRRSRRWHGRSKSLLQHHCILSVSSNSRVLFLGEGNLRRSAGHLAEETGTLRLLLLSWGGRLLCLRRGMCCGGCRSGLLGSRSLRGDCWARWCSASAAGSSLTRHDELAWNFVFLGGGVVGN